MGNETEFSEIFQRTKVKVCILARVIKVLQQRHFRPTFSLISKRKNLPFLLIWGRLH